MNFVLVIHLILMLNLKQKMLQRKLKKLNAEQAAILNLLFLVAICRIRVTRIQKDLR